MVDDEDGRALVRFRGRPSGRRAGDGLGWTYREHFSRPLGYRPAATSTGELTANGRLRLDSHVGRREHRVHVHGPGDRRPGSAERDPGSVGLDWRRNMGYGLVDDEDGNAHFQLCGDYTVVVRAIDSGGLAASRSR